MEDFGIPCQAIHWELRCYKRKPGQGENKWISLVIRRDLKDVDTDWDEAEEHWRQTQQNGVNVRTNASIWMWLELRTC